MPRNPFEQLQDTVDEPRQTFEDIVALLLKCICPQSRRVRIYRGDGGIDVYVGTLGDGGEADVYQAKYFPTPWGDSQKQQIRDSYQTARSSGDYRLKEWTLCVPVRLPKEDLRWFDEWKQKQDRPIKLMDGDELTAHLADARCAPVRAQLRELGAIGLQRGGPQLAATAFIQKPSKESGLTAVLTLRIDNEGDRSARGITATIRHTETNCLAYRENEDWHRSRGDGRTNPRELRYRHTLNPGDYSAIMSIPLCERSEMPFSVSIKLTADDCQSVTLHCQLAREQIAATKPVAFQA